MTKPVPQKPFEKQTKAQQRVTIAKDVLAQLNTRLKAKEGVWVGVKGERLPIGKNLGAEVCELTRKQKKCEVCGIGALFVAGVERADKLKVSELAFAGDGEASHTDYYDGIEHSDCFSYLERFFDEDQLDAIESAFERGEGVTSHDSLNFAENIEDASTRLRLIMENIVANKGRFKWEREPIASYSTPGFKP